MKKETETEIEIEIETIITVARASAVKTGALALTNTVPDPSVPFVRNRLAVTRDAESDKTLLGGASGDPPGKAWANREV